MAYCTPDEVAAALRISITAQNTAAMDACIGAAAEEIDHSVARAEADPIPASDPLANRVNVLRAVEWWKANDSAFGVIGFDQTGALQAPRDGFNRHAAALLPLRQRFGVS